MEKEVKELLLKSARKEAEEIIGEARRRAEEIMEGARREVEEIRKIEEEKLKRKLSIYRSKVLGKAEKEAKERILRAKHEVIERVKEKALEELSKMRKKRDEYKKVLKFLLIEAVQEVSENPEIHVNPEDKELISQVLDEIDFKAKIVEDESVLSGVVVYDVERGFVVYNTLEERLEKAKELLLEKMESIILKEG